MFSRRGKHHDSDVLTMAFGAVHDMGGTSLAGLGDQGRVAILRL
jgi:hypothetical protein